ncbi:putative membrane protein [Candidatus Phytoplasma solani]|uniref:hypothetical protein n=1 Tax=Candidatus Phytoplasma solani TaxID=69896 RepID=UPI0032D9ECF4
MVNQNIYHKNKLLRQIILASFLSYLPVALDYFLKGLTNISIGVFSIKSFTPYFIFLPLIIMSFYVPKTLACIGAFLSETLMFFLRAQKKYCYSPITSLFCVLCFVLIPSCFLKKEDSFYKFYCVILFSTILFQILSWYNVLKYRFKISFSDIPNLNKKLQYLFVMRLPVVIIIAFILVVILKKLFQKLDFFQEKQ